MSGRFVAIPLSVMDSVAYAKLKWTARALLVELAAQFKGHNNGDLSAAYALFKPRGWTRSTLQTATAELERAGFIVRTRQGGLHQCNLYALTWRAIDNCSGKNFDQGLPIGGAPLHLYAKNPSPKFGPHKPEIQAATDEKIAVSATFPVST